MSEGQIEKTTDVAEIQNLFDTVTQQAQLIHKTVLELHNRSEEPDLGKEPEAAGDVGVRFKDTLIRLQDIQRKTLTSLKGFV